LTNFEGIKWILLLAAIVMSYSRLTRRVPYQARIQSVRWTRRNRIGDLLIKYWATVMGYSY